MLLELLFEYNIGLNYVLAYYFLIQVFLWTHDILDNVTI